MLRTDSLCRRRLQLATLSSSRSWLAQPEWAVRLHEKDFRTELRILAKAGMGPSERLMCVEATVLGTRPRIRATLR